HDLMGIAEVNETIDRLRVYVAAGSADIPRDYEVAVSDPDFFRKPWDFLKIDDLPNHPITKNSAAVKAGMMSGLCVPIRFGGRLRAGVNFFSRQQNWFSESDVPIARRIANYLTLALSHYHLSEEARRRRLVEERAQQLDAQVRKLTDELDVRSGYR